MGTSWPIKFHIAAKPGVKRKSDNDAQNKNNEKYEAVFIGPSHFLSAKPIKPTVFKNSGYS
jgi:hypothetical protein